MFTVKSPKLLIGLRKTPGHQKRPLLQPRPLLQLQRRLQLPPQQLQPLRLPQPRPQLQLPPQLRRQLPLRPLPPPSLQFGANGVYGKAVVSTVVKKVELNFDSENVFKAIALAIVPIHNRVTFVRVLNGAYGVNGDLALSLVKLVQDFEFANVKMHPIIPMVVEKVTSLTMNHATKEHVLQLQQQRRLQRQRQQSQRPKLQ